MHDSEYWNWQVNSAETEEEVKAAIDGMLSSMVDAGLISMSWDADYEEFVFFMTDDQRKAHDMGHA